MMPAMALKKLYHLLCVSLIDVSRYFQRAKIQYRIVVVCFFAISFDTYLY